ncbi:DUF4411 family protein [Nocardia rosealba]|uniref:DUF4411 family protein n=1 Tax=Nocardia rosealba TaxID=2878563 RepID=UPI001CD9EDFA|nr:DUF4411 family protein [Nocardia rosealba]MCA2210570.1 DUF4411 family protein [Nocardia rosealba]
MTYIIDTNVIVLLNRYTPRSVFPSVWSAWEALIADGRAFMPREVLEELDKQVGDGLALWCKSFSGFIEEAQLPDVSVVQQIAARYPGWVQGDQNGADPWVIAHAHRHSGVVVTDEKAKGLNVAEKNLKIPNVAKDFGVECIPPIELALREGWQF